MGVIASGVNFAQEKLRSSAALPNTGDGDEVGKPFLNDGGYNRLQGNEGISLVQIPVETNNAVESLIRYLPKTRKKNTTHTLLVSGEEHAMDIKWALSKHKRKSEFPIRNLACDSEYPQIR